MPRNITSISIDPEVYEWAVKKGIKISTYLNTHLRHEMNEEVENEKAKEDMEKIEGEALEVKRKETILRNKLETIKLIETNRELASQFIEAVKSDRDRLFGKTQEHANFYMEWADKFQAVGIRVGVVQLRLYAQAIIV